MRYIAVFNDAEVSCIYHSISALSYHNMNRMANLHKLVWGESPFEVLEKVVVVLAALEIPPPRITPHLFRHQIRISE